MVLATIATATAEQEQLKQLLLANRIASHNLKFSTGLVLEQKPSPKQMYWVGKMIESATGEPQPVTTVAAQAINPGWQPDPVIKIDVTKIVDMFANARKHLKFPKVTLLMDTNDLKSGVRFSFDRKGRNMLWANQAISYGVAYASINLDTGVVDLRRYGHNVKTEFLKLLEDFSKGPIQMAIMHGKLTGNCCFCSLPLTDDRSLQCGYGDTCARHYRLPWGKQSNMTAIGDWTLNGAKVSASGAKTYYAPDHGILRGYLIRENAAAKVYGLPGMDADHLSDNDLKTIKGQIDANLSPENLSCDGEATKEQIRSTERYYASLLAEIGRLVGV